MSSAKEIRGKIGSIRNTQKITKAMEMVAASKMRKTQERMRAAQPYADKIRNVISHLARARTEYANPLLREPVKEPRRIGLIVVSSDRGLCGGLNANLFRETVRRMREWEQQGVSVGVSVIGNKAAGFFSLIGARIMSRATQLGDRPGVEQIIGSGRLMVNAYAEGDLDALYIVYNRFVNSMTQSPCLEQLLPLEPVEDAVLPEHWDYLYEPDPISVLEILIQPLYRVPDLSVGGGKHRLRASGPHGGDEERF